MKQLSLSRLGLSLFSLLLILLINGCAPIFSEMQSARTVGKNNIEATASFSSVSFRDTENKESDHTQNSCWFSGGLWIICRRGLAGTLCFGLGG